MIAITETPPALVELSEATIRVRDVVPELSGRLASRPIARLPEGRRDVTLNAAALATLIRRAAPGTPTMRVTRSMRFRQPSSVPVRRCFTAREPIGAGAAITRALVEPGRCDRPAEAVRYADGMVVAAVAIPRGANVGAMISEVAVPTIARGAALTLQAHRGVVTVERDVTALQAGRQGGRVFVRDRDGHVFAARVRVAAR